MPSTLETLSWIATVVAIPVAVIGWFFVSGKKKNNNSVAKRGGAAIAGDVRVDGPAGFVTGHQSPVSVNLTVAGKENDAYERRHAVYRTTRRLIEEAHSQFASETLRCFFEAVEDAPFLFNEDVVTYLNKISEHLRAFLAINITVESMPVGKERGGATAKAGEHRLWLIAQKDKLAAKFKPFLTLQ